ncbi:hypothetical protein CHUAL_010668 [Chamberlinius hualienensis]
MTSIKVLTFLLATASILSLYNVSAGLVRKSNLKLRDEDEGNEGHENKEKPKYPYHQNNNINYWPDNYPNNIPSGGYQIPANGAYLGYNYNDPCKGQQSPYPGPRVSPYNNLYYPSYVTIPNYNNYYYKCNGPQATLFYCGDDYYWNGNDYRCSHD